MKKKGLIFGIAALGLMISLASCVGTTQSANSTAINPNNNNTVSVDTSGNNKVTTVTPSVTAVDALESKEEITSDFNITTTDGNYTLEGTTYKITSAGTYVISGKLSDGMIYIDTEGDVELDLNGVSITSTTNSPIYAVNVDSLKIKSEENTYNEIIDSRVTSLTDTLGSAAIYSEADLKLVGKGLLYVSGLYNNGIHTKDDLDVKNVTLNVKAYNNALKGNDSITIESGNIIAISTGGDGLKTTNSDVSSKGNQRGTITISGGTIDIYSLEDGIDASYDVSISDEAVVNIYTGSNSKYSGTHASEAATDVYFRIANSYYSTSYRYAAYLYNTDGTYKWVNLSYVGTTATSTSNDNRFQSSRTSYYYYKFDMDSSYKNMAIYRFDASQTENSLTTYSAVTSGGTINTSKNMYAITSISGTQMTGDWGTYSVSSSSYSAKGIKADNEINVTGGNITISSTDDSFHANYGLTLENGEVGKGNINISGGSITVSSGDDGMHADSLLTINDGIINVVNSHEGLEGNQIYIKGGSTYVYANDDGVNATSGAKQTIIDVSGGYLDVTVGSGDTDGIDSNGSYNQTGGFVITRNPTNDTSGNMGALDIDGTFTMTGGTFIALGPVSQTPSNYNSVLFGTTGGGNMMRPGGMGMGGSSSSFSFASGEYSVSGTNISFKLSQTYYSLFIASSELKVGTEYTLSGTTTKTWTQSSVKTTISS